MWLATGYWSINPGDSTPTHCCCESLTGETAVGLREDRDQFHVTTNIEDISVYNMKSYEGVDLTFMVPCIVNVLSITNKMHLYIILFIIVSAVHVSSGFSAHHQELKSVHAASGICQTCLLLPLAWMSWDHENQSNKSDKHPMLHVQI
jgi:hypothetical protein